jgi:hypothetical protein
MEQMRDMPEGMAHRPKHSMEKSKEHQLPSSFRNSMWVKCTAAALQQCERDMEGGKLMGGFYTFKTLIENPGVESWRAL